MTTTMTAETPSKGLHYGLWVVQALAAVAFLGAGMMKATKPLASGSSKPSFRGSWSAGMALSIFSAYCKPAIC